jgi:hypothetical protein
MLLRTVPPRLLASSSAEAIASEAHLLLTLRPILMRHLDAKHVTGPKAFYKHE